MPASLVWGKGFRVCDSTTPLGTPCREVVGIDGSVEVISWSSVGKLEDLAERHGVSREIWPIYEGIERDEDIPLEDAVQRSAEVREALDELDPSVIENDYWLRIIHRLLRDGNSFFIMP